MAEYIYQKDLNRRRVEESLRSNIIFGQTLGWVLSLLGAFRYFILFEEPGLYMLLAGNILLLLGLSLPQALEYPQRLMKTTAEFASLQILRLILAIIYLLVIFPLGWLKQKIKGRVPFYYWQGDFNERIEGWTRKTSSDEGRLIKRADNFSSNHAWQLLRHFLHNGELAIMPSLLIILLLGLVAIFVQSTVVAPMIYTLF